MTGRDTDQNHMVTIGSTWNITIKLLSRFHNLFDRNISDMLSDRKFHGRDVKVNNGDFAFNTRKCGDVMRTL